MIYSFYENCVSFSYNEERVSKWVKETIEQNSMILGNLNFIFCSDEYLLDINKKYLDHDYYTDIITFNYNEDISLSGDLFISIERVNDNAIQNKILFLEELNRVIIHGVLHLLGFDDKSEEDKIIMRQKEDLFIQKYKNNVG